MSTSVESAKVVHLMTPADNAHRRLAKALERVVEDYWAIADAMHEAHESEAWMRDNGEHEGRYRALMIEHNLPSIFYAYAFNEFGLRTAYVGYIDIAGRLRAAVMAPTTQVVVDWSRFTMTGVRPVSAAIVSGYEGANIAAALVTAQRFASIESRKHPAPGTQPTKSTTRLPCSAAMSAPPSSNTDSSRPAPPMSPSLRRASAAPSDSTRAGARLAKDMAMLLAAQRRRAVVNMMKSAIARLSDQPAMLAELRAALNEVTS